MLVDEGLLERRAGKGLFVATPRPASNTGMVQVVVGNLEWIPCVRAARGCQQAARASGMQVQIYDAHGNMDLDLDMLRRLPDSGARGAVIHALHDRAFAEALYSLHARGFPFVLVDQRLNDIDVPSVLADNQAGGQAIAAHLLEQGHRRIGFVGDLGAGTVRDRLAGMRDAIGDAGLPFDRSLVVDIRPGDQLGDWTASVAAQTRALLGRPDRPSAIFGACDANARDVIRAATAMGLRVPADLGVAGFDDDPLAAPADVGLTTMRQPFDDMGRTAFEILARRIADPRTPVEHAVLPVSLVARASTARSAATVATPT